MIHAVKGFGTVSETEADVFLEFPCFFYDLTDAGSLISGSSAFSKSSMNIYKFKWELTFYNNIAIVEGQVCIKCYTDTLDTVSYQININVGDKINS